MNFQKFQKSIMSNLCVTAYNLLEMPRYELQYKRHTSIICITITKMQHTLE